MAPAHPPINGDELGTEQSPRGVGTIQGPDATLMSSCFRNNRSIIRPVGHPRGEQRGDSEACRYHKRRYQDPKHTPKMLPGEANGQRVDPESAIKNHGTYRDPWERRLRPLNEPDWQVPCVENCINFASTVARRKAACLQREGNGL